jgi:AAA+ ATPase superfamily predicted ATPase
MRIPKNPFDTNTYCGSEYFCDREDELNKLISLLSNGNSVTLYSLRRLGKTGLIHHLFNNLPKDFKTVYVDILNTSNTKDFLDSLATSIILHFPQHVGFGKKVWNFILTLRPTINFDPLSGMPQVSFSLQNSDAKQNIEAIFGFLEKQDEITIIAIDEFQQITEYPDKYFDAWLRSRFQLLNNIGFIFSGSNQHLMIDLFNSPKRPFYRSTNMIKLEKINRQVYTEFIIRMFDKYKKNISPEIVENILDWTDLHTFYVQQLCNRVFSCSGKTVKETDWKNQASLLLSEQQDVFYSLRQLLTKNQWLLLTAIASQNNVEQPTSQEFIAKYGLPGSASILKSLKYLSDKGLVYKDFYGKGNQFYAVYDLYLRRWCQNKSLLK